MLKHETATPAPVTPQLSLDAILDTYSLKFSLKLRSLASLTRSVRIILTIYELILCVNSLSCARSCGEREAIKYRLPKFLGSTVIRCVEKCKHTVCPNDCYCI